MKKMLFFLAFISVLRLASYPQNQPNAEDSIILVNAKGDTIRSEGVVFKKVEVESEFPGGAKAWQTFLASNLEYPEKAIKKRIQGTVMLQFIVCTDGTVCNIEAIKGPKELRKAALEAIKNTPNWIPAEQGGKKVKSYKRQPIVFALQYE
jgi:periplasmic protein TonB